MSEFGILEKALNGKTLDDVFIIDCHGHLDAWKTMQGIECDAGSMINSMDRIGIDMLCINKWNCPDLNVANMDVAKAVKKYPDRFIGYASTQPCLGKQATLDELKRCFDELGFKGIKVHNGYEMLSLRDMWNLPEFQETMNAIWSFANERKCSLLCHWSVPVEVVKRYTEAKFIIAHSLGVREYAHLYKPYSNVFFDTAASSTLRGNLDYFIREVGVDRILYGSDMPFANPAYRLGQIVGTRVPDESMKRILGINIANLLNINIPVRHQM